MKVLYFGCVRQAGHFMFNESLCHVHPEVAGPWNPYDHLNGIDCQLQPGCWLDNDRWRHGVEVEGAARLHHRDGWTAMSFWDRSVDKRGGCNSTFFAEGTWSFAEMISIAITHYPDVWRRFKFEIVEAK